MAGVHTIDKMPAKDREAVIKALAEAGDTPDYRGIIKRLGLKCSHMSLWRYHRSKVKPAMARNTAAILQASKSMDIDIDHMDMADSTELERQVKDVTVQRLSDDPIVQAIIAKRSRIERAISETFDTKAFDMYAKLESVDLRALEMHAKAMQHPGFVASAPQQSAGTTVVVVMPTAADPRMQAWQARQSVIDVTPEE